MKIKNIFYIIIAGYAGTLLRLTLENNLITSIVGSFFLGFILNKKLSLSKEKILFSGFFSCFTSFSGFIYFLYEVLNQGDLMKFIIFLNLIIIVNLLTMIFGFWIGRKMN